MAEKSRMAERMLPVAVGHGYSLKRIAQKLASKGLVGAVLNIPLASPWMVADIMPEAGRHTITLKNLALIESTGRVTAEHSNSLRKIWVAGPNLPTVQQYLRLEGYR